MVLDATSRRGVYGDGQRSPSSSLRISINGPLSGSSNSPTASSTVGASTLHSTLNKSATASPSDNSTSDKSPTNGTVPNAPRQPRSSGSRLSPEQAAALASPILLSPPETSPSSPDLTGPTGYAAHSQYSAQYVSQYMGGSAVRDVVLSRSSLSAGAGATTATTATSAAAAAAAAASRCSDSNSSSGGSPVTELAAPPRDFRNDPDGGVHFKHQILQGSRAGVSQQQHAPSVHSPHSQVQCSDATAATSAAAVTAAELNERAARGRSLELLQLRREREKSRQEAVAVPIPTNSEPVVRQVSPNLGVRPGPSVSGRGASVSSVSYSHQRRSNASWPGLTNAMSHLGDGSICGSITSSSSINTHGYTNAHGYTSIHGSSSNNYNSHQLAAARASTPASGLFSHVGDLPFTEGALSSEFRSPESSVAPESILSAPNSPPVTAGSTHISSAGAALLTNPANAQFYHSAPSLLGSTSSMSSSSSMASPPTPSTPLHGGSSGGRSISVTAMPLRPASAPPSGLAGAAYGYSVPSTPTVRSPGPILTTSGNSGGGGGGGGSGSSGSVATDSDAASRGRATPATPPSSPTTPRRTFGAGSVLSPHHTPLSPRYAQFEVHELFGGLRRDASAYPASPTTLSSAQFASLHNNARQRNRKRKRGGAGLGSPVTVSPSRLDLLSPSPPRAHGAGSSLNSGFGALSVSGCGNPSNTTDNIYALHNNSGGGRTTNNSSGSGTPTSADWVASPSPKRRRNASYKARAAADLQACFSGLAPPPRVGSAPVSGYGYGYGGMSAAAAAAAASGGGGGGGTGANAHATGTSRATSTTTKSRGRSGSVVRRGSGAGKNLGGSNKASGSRSPTKKRASKPKKKRLTSQPEPGDTSRVCFACGTKKTPLWRRTPVTSTNLCNACGIRWARGRLAVKIPGERGSKR